MHTRTHRSFSLSLPLSLFLSLSLSLYVYVCVYVYVYPGHSINKVAQSVEAAEYTNCISAEE